MKRMSEVFELPIDVSAAYAYGFNTIAEAHKIGRCPSAQHAAHAINHVGALADALDEILELASDAGLQNRNFFSVAQEALNAYRGTK